MADQVSFDAILLKDMWKYHRRRHHGRTDLLVRIHPQN